MIAITVDAGRVPAQLASVAQAVRDQWWREYSTQAMSVLEKEQARHFDTQSGPNGERWPGLSALTLALSAGAASKAVGGATKFTRTKSGGWRARGKGGAEGQRSATVRRTSGSKALLNAGQLRASVTAGRANGAIRRIGSNELVFGTRLPGAARLHFGGKWPVTLKQRAYLSALLGEWFLGKAITTPARPFLGVSPRCRKELEAAGVAVANRLLRKATQ